MESLAQFEADAEERYRQMIGADDPLPVRAARMRARKATTPITEREEHR